MFDIKLWDDIVKCCNNENVKEEVDKRVRLFYPIDAEGAINKITHVASLLEIVYTACKAYGNYGLHIVDVLNRYQDVVKNTVAACTNSTNFVIEALYFHRHALLFAEKGKGRKAITFLSKCANPASKIADECDKMAKQIEELSDSWKEAFIITAESYEDDTGDQQFTERLSLLSEYLEELMQKLMNLGEEVEKAMHLVEQNKERQKTSKDGLTFGLLSPISYTGTGPETKSMDLLIALQKEAKELNEDLIQSIMSFKEMEYAQNNFLSSAICFEICIKVLEKVQRLFANSRNFWRSVEYSFKLLPSSNAADRLSDDDVMYICKGAFLTEIKASGVGWLVMGTIYRQAALNIRDVSNGLNLSRPKVLNGKEYDALIEKLATSLLSEITAETEKVDDPSCDCLYEIVLAERESPDDDDDDVEVDDASETPLENGVEHSEISETSE